MLKVKKIVQNQFLGTILFFIYFMHSIFYMSSVGNYWDEKYHVITGGRFLYNIKLFISGDGEKILSDMFLSEFYNGFYQGVIQVVTEFLINISPIYNLLLSYEIIFNSTDYFYFLRHFLNFLFIFTLLIICYFLLKNLTNNVFANIFLVLFLFYPSILGNSSYNSLDLPFAIIIFLSFLIFFFILEKRNSILEFSFLDQIIVSFFFSLIISTRFSGIVFIFPLFLYSNFYLVETQQYKKFYRLAFNLLIFTILFHILLTPASWGSLIKYSEGVINAQFFNPWTGSTLTNGEFIFAQNVKFYYLFVWFFYKTPIILFPLIIAYIFKRKLNKISEISKFSYFFIIYVFLIHAIFRPISYNGVRHYLFLIPFIVIISTQGLLLLNKLKYLLLLIIPIYLISTQYQLDQYKYSYFNEFTNAKEISFYCKENINGCGNWGTDYYAISGKEFVDVINRNQVDVLYICEPSHSLTPYLSESTGLSEPYLWEFKNGIPVANETIGFKQFNIIYSEGHFEEFLLDKEINQFYIFSIHSPQEGQDTCHFNKYINSVKVECDLVDSVNRKFRGENINFSYLSFCNKSKV
jgi:hypothetical protein